MLNDQIKGQVPPIELIEKNGDTKDTEKAGRFSNDLQTQKGFALSAVFLGIRKKLFGNKSDGKSDADIKTNKASELFNSAMKPLNKVFDKIPDDVAYAYPKLVEYDFNRIAARSSRIRNFFDKLDGLGEFNSSGHEFSKHIAKRWAGKVGASAEEASEFAGKLTKHSMIMHDYHGVLTRNEFKKKYPHLKELAQAADDIVQADRSQSLKGIVKNIRQSRVAKSLRQYREPNSIEAGAFAQQLREHMGLNAAKYQVNLFGR